MQDGQSPATLSELLGSDMWSNAACCGYVILACKNLGHTKAEIKKLLVALNAVFSNYTMQEAEVRYFEADI